jgi:hypothetical protein
MNKIQLFWVMGGLLAILNLNARADLFVFPTADAAWTVDITQESSTPARGAYLKHVEVTQVDKLKKIHLDWSDGTSSEKWTIPGLPVTFVQNPRTGTVWPQQNGSAMQTSSNFGLTYDSFAFAWIKPENLQEKTPISYQGKQCFHYIGSTTYALPGSKPSDEDKREAWIDAKTLYPVALDTGSSLTTFTFQDKPPTGPLTPPPEFEKEIAYYKAVMGFR